MSSSSIIQPLLSSFQASLSVLLLVLYGSIATRLNLLSPKTSTQLSQLCVKLLLPVLLFTNLGSTIHPSTFIPRYVPILIWSTFYNIISIAIGHAAVKLLKLPAWVTPAIAFNNTTALPIVLVESLKSAGGLGILNTSEDVDRAKSYFLVNSVIGTCLTFAVGPQLMNAWEEDVPSTSSRKDEHSVEDHSTNNHDQGQNDEETPLLSNDSNRRPLRTNINQTWQNTPAPLKKTLKTISKFFNAPSIGAILGLIVGLTPLLSKAFFADSSNGGIFNSWLTTSLKQFGNLFAALQTVTVGTKLVTALQSMKSNHHQRSNDDDDPNNTSPTTTTQTTPTGTTTTTSTSKTSLLPWKAMLLIETTRHIIWPSISIPLIYLLTSKTTYLPSNDKVLWFSMMLMPTGPPALKITALADVNGTDEREKMNIARFLAVSYCISPVMAFAVLGSLEAVKAVG